MKSKPVVNINEAVHWPKGFTISDNRLEDYLQRFLTPAAYVIYRQYLRFWGSNKGKAYPSLSTLKERTGLSEKTIRKVNLELQKKGFIKYIRGGPNRSNQYHSVCMDKLLERYRIQIEEIEFEAEIGIPEQFVSVDEIELNLDDLRPETRPFAQDFLIRFQKAFEEYKNFPYPLDAHDLKTLSKNASRLVTKNDDYIALIDIYFKSKNSYIQRSDYSIHFFFSPKIQKTLITEYGETPAARWQLQAEQSWKSLRVVLEGQFEDLKSDLEIIAWVQKYTHLPGANKERDEFVVSYLVNKVKQYLSLTT
jgi:hypothetical protein